MSRDKGEGSDGGDFRLLFNVLANSAPQERPARRPTVLKLLGVVALAGLLAAMVALPYVGGIGLAAGGAANRFLRDRCDLQETDPPQRTTVYASDGKTVIANLFSQDREPVALATVPRLLQQALIATEDRRFYGHHGVDLRGLVRSAVATGKGDVQGGSTLTMQYVKEERFYQARNDAERAAAVDQTVERKIADAKCALYLEGTLNRSKAKILEKYLNIAFFGENSYGVQIAAQTYFGVKDVSQLKPWQSAMLVGLVKSPTEFDPYGNNGHNAAATKVRRNEVLQNLVDVGDITPAQGRAWQAKPLSLAASKAPMVREGCSGTTANTAIKNAGFFCDYLTDWLVDSSHGPRLSERQLREGGLKIVSTLDVGKQNLAQAALSRISPTAATAAIMPEIDPRTGGIVAMATSKRYGVTRGGGHTVLPIFTQNTVNGSATFELFPMLAALTAGADWSTQFSAQRDDKGKIYYSPKSCSSNVSRFYNNDAVTSSLDETMESAVAKAATTYFVALEDRFFPGCDLRSSVDVALRLGMNSLREMTTIHGKTTSTATRIVSTHAADFALGAYKTNPMELTAAYAALANDGVFNAPTPVKYIARADGSPVSIERPSPTRVLSSDVAIQAGGLLFGQVYQGVTADQFTTWTDAIFNPPLAAATGANFTGQQSHGAPVSSSMWFVGATPHLVGTTLLMNLAHPSAALTGLPSTRGNPIKLQSGGYAAMFWRAAVERSVRGDSRYSDDPRKTDPPTVDMTRHAGLSRTPAVQAGLGSR